VNICAVIREEKERTGEGNYEGAANDSKGCKCGSRVIDEGGGERALGSDDGAGGKDEKEGGPHPHGWKEGGGERSAEERHVLGRKSRGKGRHDLKVSKPSRQVECLRKRTLVAQTASRYPRQRISNHSGPKCARIESFPRRSGEKEERDSLFQSTLTKLPAAASGGEISFTISFVLPKSRVHRT